MNSPNLLLTLPALEKSEHDVQVAALAPSRYDMVCDSEEFGEFRVADGLSVRLHRTQSRPWISPKLAASKALV